MAYKGPQGACHAQASTERHASCRQTASRKERLGSDSASEPSQLQSARPRSPKARSSWCQKPNEA
eukprot:2533559-Pyramimonas_sp.AAC.1